MELVEGDVEEMDATKETSTPNDGHATSILKRGRTYAE